MIEEISFAPGHSALYAKYQAWRETGHNISYIEWLEIELTVDRDNNDWMINQYKETLAHRDETIRSQEQLLAKVRGENSRLCIMIKAMHSPLRLAHVYALMVAQKDESEDIQRILMLKTLNEYVEPNGLMDIVKTT